MPINVALLLMLCLLPLLLLGMIATSVAGLRRSFFVLSLNAALVCLVVSLHAIGTVGLSLVGVLAYAILAAFVLGALSFVGRTTARPSKVDQWPSSVGIGTATFLLVNGVGVSAIGTGRLFFSC